MKIIFLDIDGVLNSSDYRKQLGIRYFSEIIDRRKMPLLKNIVDATDAKIVLSTSWRKFWNEGESQLDPVGQYINEVFAAYGLSVYAKTPVMEESGRNAEIKAWLDGKWYVDSYVILDDKDFGWSPELRAHFIRTDLNGDGLEEAQVQETIDVLNGNLRISELKRDNKWNAIRFWLRYKFGRQ